MRSSPFVNAALQGVKHQEAMIKRIKKSDTDALKSQLGMETSLKHSQLSILHALQSLAALLDAHDQTAASKHIMSAATILSNASAHETSKFVQALIKEAGSLPGKKPEVNVHLLSIFCQKHIHEPEFYSSADAVFVHNFCKEIVKARKKMSHWFYDTLDDTLSSMRQYVPAGLQNMNQHHRYLAVGAGGLAAGAKLGLLYPGLAGLYYLGGPANAPFTGRNRDAYYKLLQTGVPIDSHGEMPLADK